MPTIKIDYGTNPYAQNRFCLGKICNYRRKENVERVRSSIGKGITIQFNPSRCVGEQYFFNSDSDDMISAVLTNNSNGKIFVQSPISNHKRGIENVYSVDSVPSGHNIELFDKFYFQSKIEESIKEEPGLFRISNMAHLAKVNIRIGFYPSTT